jgi:hypothetical protein
LFGKGGLRAAFFCLYLARLFDCSSNAADFAFQILSGAGRLGEIAMHTDQGGHNVILRGKRNDFQ